MNKTWMQPPFARYMASLTGAMTSVECRIRGGLSTPDRGVEAVTALLDGMKARRASCWLFGNGGSASIADHIACDMRIKGWRAHALTNFALTTSMANDHGYPRAFAAQMDHVVAKGDVLIGMSCSGESANVLNAMRYDMDLTKIVLSGFKADNHLNDPRESHFGDLPPPDVCFWVPSSRYGEVQIAHLAILHAVVDL